jgi:hypothetical protein
MVRWAARQQRLAVRARRSGSFSTGWEHDDGSFFCSSTAAVGSASTSERISTDCEHDGAVGCCFARRERWEGRFLVRVG